MPEVQCLDCGKFIKLPTYGYWNYKGRIKCTFCGTLWYIEIQNGDLIKEPVKA